MQGIYSRLFAISFVFFGFTYAFSAQAIPVGYVSTDFGSAEGIRAMAVQPDGKIIAAGYQYGPSGFALSRYNANGTLDTTFGSGGKVITTYFFGTTVDESSEAFALGLQPDGKIVLAGYTQKADFAVARYNPNGSLDSTFGIGGQVATDLGHPYDLIYAMAIQADGKIVVGGFTIVNGSPDYALVRYHVNGALDNSFGVGGIVITDFDGGSDDRITALTIQPDGLILAAGRSALKRLGGFGGYDMAIARYNSNGTLDTTFGVGGKSKADLGGRFDEIRAMTLLTGGKIMAAGSGGTGDDIALARFNVNGTLDTRFGSNGFVITPSATSSFDQATSIYTQADGNFMVSAVTNGVGALLRYTSRGGLDSSFGVGGIATSLVLQTGTYDVGLALQADGKPVLGGILKGASTRDDFGLIRFNANGTADTSFGPRADLSVTLSDSPDPVKVGQNLTYTITVTNLGLNAAADVITGGVPIWANLVSASATTGTCQNGICNLGILLSGASATATVVVSPIEVGTLSHTTSVSSTTADSNVVNNSASTSTTITGAADLSLSLTVNPGTAKIKQDATYTAVITNNGPDASANVSFLANIPGYFISSTTTQGSCSGASCSIGTINAGASVTVTYTMRMFVNGIYWSTATVTGVADTNTANNSAAASVTVASVSDLALAVTASPNPVRTGNTLTYTVTVTNLGPDTAYTPAVRLRGFPSVFNATLGASVGASCQTFNSSDSNDQNLYCGVSDIPAATSTSFTVAITPFATGSISVTGTVSIDGNPGQDSNPTNNSAIVSTTVDGSADLSVTTVASPDPVRVGNNVTYTTTVTNHGPDIASVGATPNIPFGTIGVSITPSQGYCDPYNGSSYGAYSTRCSLGSIASGASVTITSVFTPQITGNLVATTTVGSVVSDPNTVNNSATTSTTVTGAADLAVSITDSPDPIRIGNNLTYSIALTNNGSDFASSATLSDTLPTGVSFVSATSSLGSCYLDLGVVTCAFGNLNSGITATVNIVVTVNVKRTTLTNTVTVSSAVTDPNTANNSATAVTTVQ